MVENVKTKKILKFRWLGHMPHVWAEGSPRVRRSLGHVDRDTWGGCISNFKRIEQKMQFLHQFEYQIFKNLCFLKKNISPLKIMDLDNSNRFCITKNISLLKEDFSRGWCFQFLILAVSMQNHYIQWASSVWKCSFMKMHLINVIPHNGRVNIPYYYWLAKDAKWGVRCPPKSKRIIFLITKDWNWSNRNNHNYRHTWRLQ